MIRFSHQNYLSGHQTVTDFFFLYFVILLKDFYLDNILRDKHKILPTICIHLWPSSILLLKRKTHSMMLPPPRLIAGGIRGMWSVSFLLHRGFCMQLKMHLVLYDQGIYVHMFVSSAVDHWYWSARKLAVSELSLWLAWQLRWTVIFWKVCSCATLYFWSITVLLGSNFIA